MTFGDPQLPERFWEKVIPEPNSGCWIFLGFLDKKGYGKFWYNKRSCWAHRLVKDFKLTAHHKCFTNCCVNPEHLQDVTREINSHLGHHPSSYYSDSYSEEVPF